MIKLSLKFLIITAFFILHNFAVAQDSNDQFLYDSFTSERYFNYTVHYRLFVPEDYRPANNYPVVIYLHGAGRNGSDNESQLTNRATIWAGAEVQEEQRCFVLVPQCPSDMRWSTFPSEHRTIEPEVYLDTFVCPIDIVMEIYDRITDRYSINTDRLYVSGHSMGCWGTYAMVYKYGHRIAAIATSASGWFYNQDQGIYDNENNDIFRMPVWRFCGQNDMWAVNYSRLYIDQASEKGIDFFVTDCNHNPISCTPRPSREIEEYVNNNGNYLYTELEGRGHNMNGFFPNHQEHFHEWLFSKNLQNKPILLSNKKYEVKDFRLSHYPNPVVENTTIQFHLEQPGNVTIAIYSLTGTKIKAVCRQYFEKGKHSISFHSEGLEKGSYLYKLSSDRYFSVNVMTVL